MHILHSFLDDHIQPHMATHARNPFIVEGRILCTQRFSFTQIRGYNIRYHNICLLKISNNIANLSFLPSVSMLHNKVATRVREILWFIQLQGLLFLIAG